MTQQRVTTETQRGFVPLRSQPIGPTVLDLDTPAVIYTAPASYDFIFRHMWAANIESATRTISLYLVADGETANDSNAICKEYEVAPFTTVRLGFMAPDSGLGVLMPPGMTLQGSCSNADAVNIGGWGHEVAGGV